MTGRDKVWGGGLILAAGWFWLRDRSWLTSAEEVVPILAALPLFVWLGAPWWFRVAPFSLAPIPLGVAAVSLVAGLALDLTFLLAIAWTAALWAWLSARLAQDRLPHIRRLLVLPLMAFPWVALDGAPVGWWFRLSAAGVAGEVFSWVGLAVTRDGTHLLVQVLPVAVDASCSGLKVLQAMLIAGTILAYGQLGRTRSYWWSLPALVLIAWLANTLRVITLSVAALTAGPEFAAGWFHMWGGWLVLALMFVGSASVFGLWRRLAGGPSALLVPEPGGLKA